jgi:hypothetical protein
MVHELLYAEEKIGATAHISPNQDSFATTFVVLLIEIMYMFLLDHADMSNIPIIFAQLSNVTKLVTLVVPAFASPYALYIL